ncbi:MAG TPA: DUF4032 domain-containing protein [Ktedonobacteraceae bacterium]|nr:DUF4032 domain-containing protein [Ktedonobacteraceae bacterium]
MQSDERNECNECNERIERNQRNQPQFSMSRADEQRLRSLPWHVPLSEWPEHGVVPLAIRRGESRHPVIFVERDSVRYAIKETTPHMAAREIHNLREIEFRGIPTLSACGTVAVHDPPIVLEAPETGVAPQLVSGDRGYTVTHLAERVIPQALLFRLPFSRKSKERLLGAIAVLMVELHEHGVYWGDPSLANVLIRIDGRQILAIMSDAETAELFSGSIEEGLRAQDLESFHESMIWQAEDLRIERGMEEEDELLEERDYRYFQRRYTWLRREHARLHTTLSIPTFIQMERFLNNLNRLGFSLLSVNELVLSSFVSVLPGWHVNRIQELLGIQIPRKHARRFYNMILGHQAIMREKLGREVSIQEAARDWYEHYHLPTVLLLRQTLTSNQDPYEAYFAIMRHKWKMSEQAGHEVPLDEATLDWAMLQAEKGTLGTFDPAAIASWWRDRKSAAQALEPPMIEKEKLAPLLPKEEQLLIQLPTPQLEEKLQEKLDADT